jgi:RNA polymerase sigma-70 factor (ECF subfamily)
MTTTAQPPSLATLYERYGPSVHQRCRYLLGDDASAWDATQDVFMKAERARAKFEGRASWHTWLSRIATHHCLNVLRSRRVRRGTGLVPAEDLDHHRPAAAESTSETATLVRRLLEQFDAKTQAVAIHYYVDEMSQQEVADLVGLSVPTVRKHLRTFVRRARRALEPGGLPAVRLG